MKTYHISEDEMAAMRQKIEAAQTLLNVNCAALVAGLQPVPASTRLDLAEDAEDLVHDVGDILDELFLRG